MALTINNFNILSKTLIFASGVYGAYSGFGAWSANNAEWDMNALVIAKRYKEMQAKNAPKPVASVDAPLELAPGVPLPAELADVVKSLA